MPMYFLVSLRNCLNVAGNKQVTDSTQLELLKFSYKYDVL